MIDGRDRVELGLPVSFTRTLTRREVRENGRPRKVWSPERYVGEPEPAPRTGILVGVRTLSNGGVEYGYDEPTIYTPTEHFTAFLIAFDTHRRPVLVLPEHVTSLRETTLLSELVS